MSSDPLLAGNSITVDITTRTPHQLTKVVYNPPQANLRSLLRWSCNLPLLPPTPGISTGALSNTCQYQTSYGNLTEGAGLALYKDLDLCSDLAKLFCLLSRWMGTHCKLSRTITVNGVEYAEGTY